MANCAIVGINWGDEGKGRMVDLLTQDYDIVVRYQGGGNAGHTVINEYGKFALHLLPSGIFRPNVVNILGNGVALDMKSLCGEMENVTAKGVSVTPENLKISDRASLVLPWHILLDELEEERLKDKKYGSTKQGIAPFYSDKYQKKTIQAGELFYPEYMVRHLEDLLEWKNLTLTGVYGAKPYTMAQLCDYLHTYGQKLRPFICDTGSWLREAQQDGKSILFEAQLGALRDLDYGIYPYTTSSNTIAAYAPIGAGLPTAKIDQVVGVLCQKDFYCNGKMTERPIAEIMTAPLFVYQHTKIRDILKMLQHQKSHVAVVVDDFGGTLGIVTMEDILEELVGEIWDEHDEVEEDFEKLDENTYRVDCSVSLEDFMEFFGVKLESDSVSVGGWVMEQLNRVPIKGDSFTAQNLEITVSDLSAYRVSFITVRQCGVCLACAQ